MIRKLAVALVFAAATFAQEHPLTTELQKLRVPIALKDGKLAGPGADLLAHELATTQFFLLGEEHGTAETARFATALLPAAWRNGYRHVAIEVGPFSVARIGTDAASLEQFNRKYAWGLPFLNWKEEAEFYEAAMKLGGGRRDTIWGIDQEFVLALTPNLERLVALAKNDQMRAVASKLLERSRAGEAEMLKTKDPKALLMLSGTAAEFEELRKAFATADDEAVKLAEALVESREIYEKNFTVWWESNDQRARLIKRLFAQSYAQAVAKGEAKPKVLVKLGATHTMRGRSITSVYDIGNMLPELAAANGTRSFQIMVLPRSGFTNAHRPFSPDTSDKRQPYDPAKALPFDAKPLLDAAAAGEWSLFDLRKLRVPLARRKLEPLDERLQRVLWGFDAILVIPDVTPATLFE